MAILHVGQRVRIGGKYESQLELDPDPTGLEAVIVGPDPWAIYDWEILASNGHGYFYDSWELEPIQPEGYKVVTWAECPWQPKDWQPKREEQVA